MTKLLAMLTTGFVLTVVATTGNAGSHSDTRTPLRHTSSRSFGIGVDAPIVSGGSPQAAGISVSLGLGRNLVMQAIAAMRHETRPVPDQETSPVPDQDIVTSTTTVFLAPRIMTPLLSTATTVLFGVGGAIFELRRRNNGVAKHNQLIGGLEAGVRPEYRASEHLSFHVQLGVGLLILGETFENENNGGTFMSVFQNAQLLGNAGLTFWF